MPNTKPIPSEQIFARAQEVTPDALANSADDELSQFILATVERLLSIKVRYSIVSQWNLWFFSEREDWELKIHIEQIEENFRVFIFENLSRGFDDTVQVVSNREDVKSYLAAYFMKVHAFRFNRLRVLTGWAAPKASADFFRKSATRTL